MLTVPNARIDIWGPETLQKLSNDGQIETAPMRLYPNQRALLRSRDWRQIREKLVGLDFQDYRRLAEWLNEAGYVTVESRSWTPEEITPQMANWVKANARIVTWLMELPAEALQHAVHCAERFFDVVTPYDDEDQAPDEREALSVLEQSNRLLFDPGAIADPELADRERIAMPIIQRMAEKTEGARPAVLPKLLKDIGAPLDFDPQVLRLYLKPHFLPGVQFQSKFWIEQELPVVCIQTHSPVEAISMSIELDRRYTQRRGSTCKRCGKPFEKTKKRDLFCSSICQNNWHSTERRKRLKALYEFRNKWKAMNPSAKTKLKDPYKWIAEQASNVTAADPPIAADWAKREIEKAEQKGKSL